MKDGGKFKEFMNKDIETFEDFCNPELRRAEQMKVKTEAVWVSFLELRDIINLSGFAKKYFNHTHAWFSQRLNENRVNGKQQKFTSEDCDKIASSFRSLANQLTAYADAIEKAE